MLAKALGSILGGAIGGAVGTAFMKTGMQMSDRLPERLQPPAMSRDPGDFLVEKLEQRRGQPLSETNHKRAASGLHWLYGVSWGTALGAAGPALGMASMGKAAAAGAAMGAGVWAAGYAGWLPRANLTPSLREQSAGAIASSLTSHIAYGVLTAVPIFLVNRYLSER